MRNIIDENITLEEPGHKYVLETDPSIEFQSVTELIGNYFEPFDKHAIAEKLVATNPKYMDTTAEALIAKWDAARDHGTKVHSEIELYLNKSIVPDEPKARDAIEWLKKYPPIKDNIESIKTAVLWKKLDSTFEPDYCAERLEDNPWIVQPFENYEEVTIEELVKKHKK